MSIIDSLSSNTVEIRHCPINIFVFLKSITVSQFSKNRCQNFAKLNSSPQPLTLFIKTYLYANSVTCACTQRYKEIAKHSCAHVKDHDNSELGFCVCEDVRCACKKQAHRCMSSGQIHCWENTKKTRFSSLHKYNFDTWGVLM